MADKYQALREAAEKATSGPWASTEHGVGEFCVYVDDPESELAVVFVDHDPRYKTHDSMEQQGKDVAFIAAANPATIQALLAERDALRAALSNLEVSANTVVYCYKRQLEGLARSVAVLELDTETARTALSQ